MKEFKIWLLLMLLFLFLAAFMVAVGRASTTKKVPNSLGTPQFLTNQWSYLLALPLDGQVLEGKYTNVRFQPYGTPELFDVTLLFCGDTSETFGTKKGPLVIVYRTQASRVYQGVACHELKAVFEVQK